MTKNRLLGSLLVLLISGMGAVDTHAQTLKNYVKQRQEEMIEIHRIEKINYEKASQSGTLDAYREYLKMYPNGRYVSDISNRISDFDMWSKAKTTNTIDAYNNYIKKATFKSYEVQANEAIYELQSITAWQKFKSGDNIKDVKCFIKKFPNSSCVITAKKRVHELQAINFYNTGNYTKAYDEFNEAGGRNSIDLANRESYDKCLEYHAYRILNSDSDFQSFMTKYPDSQYYNEVSNMMAISKAKKLDMYSDEYFFNEALRYVKNEKTKSTVKSYIKNCKKSYSTHKKQQRISRIRANGGYINFGVEVLDFGVNAISSDRHLNVHYYNVGASVRLGNYKSPVQFELGIKPGLLFLKNAEEEDTDEYDDYEIKLHMPIYAKLKTNIFNADDISKVYISILATYNTVRDESLENKFSVGGGFGIAWRHWDWFILYYKQDLENKDEIDGQFIGTSFAYYF